MDARVPAGAAGDILENRARALLITGKTVIQAPIGFIEGLVTEPGFKTGPQTVARRVPCIVVPGFRACRTEALLLKAANTPVGEPDHRGTPAHRRGQIPVVEVGRKILQGGTGPAMPLVRHRIAAVLSRGFISKGGDFIMDAVLFIGNGTDGFLRILNPASILQLPVWITVNAMGSRMILR